MAIAESTVEKLDPRRIRGISPKFVAVLGYILDQHWTNPQITDMVVTSDGIVLAGTEDDPFDNDIIGSVEDLDRNLRGVAAAVGLTTEENAYLQLRRVARVRQA